MFCLLHIQRKQVFSRARPGVSQMLGRMLKFCVLFLPVPLKTRPLIQGPKGGNMSPPMHSLISTMYVAFNSISFHFI